MARGHMRKSDEYRAWKDDAALKVAHQMGGQPPLMWFTAAMIMPPTRRDLDNSIKPTLDALQAGGAVDDDKRLRALIISVDDSRRGSETVLIQLRPASEPEKPAKKGKKK
jgi:Holliday junction resolvase RusA-like endonuclease